MSLRKYDSLETLKSYSFWNFIRIDYIRLNPDPPVKGKTLHIDFKGTLSEPVTEGAYVVVQVKFGLVQLIKKTFDLCEEIEKIDKKCPLDKGPIEISRDVDLPRAIRKFLSPNHHLTTGTNITLLIHGWATIYSWGKW